MAIRLDNTPSKIKYEIIPEQEFSRLCQCFPMSQPLPKKDLSFAASVIAITGSLVGGGLLGYYAAAPARPITPPPPRESSYRWLSLLGIGALSIETIPSLVRSIIVSLTTKSEEIEAPNALVISERKSPPILNKFSTKKYFIFILKLLPTGFAGT